VYRAAATAVAPEEVKTMRSDMPAAASKAEAASPPAWARNSSIVIAVLLVGAVLWPRWWSPGEGAAETGMTPACAPWDDLARKSIAQRVQNGKRDADLRQVGDAIFRLRRARRNCQSGWTTLACQDYLAVLNAAASLSPGLPVCTMAKMEAADAAH
jgi:hypothetical protein